MVFARVYVMKKVLSPCIRTLVKYTDKTDDQALIVKKLEHHRAVLLQMMKIPFSKYIYRPAAYDESDESRTMSTLMHRGKLRFLFNKHSLR